MEVARTEGGGVEQGTEIAVTGTALVADRAGAFYWPAERLLAVADLHLEKGSSFAERGVLLPPYDTRATISRMAVLVTRYVPRTVIALGDSYAGLRCLCRRSQRA
jgi:metallophosphoesterase superfamily enzyme